MTRPGIVRADTIDLQDQEAPSSQDHSKNSAQHTDFSDNLLGRHQAAEVRHVIQERHTEEQNLQDAWGSPNGDGGEHDSEVDGEDARSTAESDAESATSDDDMMDRISSSPSIDDGAYNNRSPAWPRRSSSLTHSSTSIAASFCPLVNSSPFADEPSRFSLPATAPAGDYDSPASTQRSSSPYSQSPQHLPLWSVAKQDEALQTASNSHHPVGEYGPDQEFCEYNSDDTYGIHEHDTTNCDITNKGQQRNMHDGSHDSDYDTISDWHDALDDREPLSNDHSMDMVADRETTYCRKASPTVDDLPQDLAKDDRADSPTGSSSSWTTSSSESVPFNKDDSPTEDDDSGDLSYYSDERFVDSGWGGECLRETEDIDFDFVYALHTFVATVEGQANATKGDTMVLLDDSNSYWWLVRVVKDSSIGYLPAEHIETPTERLARLNKHRNVDLSAAMLGDNAERSKNPLKKAKRRRNAKQVSFAAPTYVEASDYEYSSADEEETAEPRTNGVVTNGQSTQTAPAQQADTASLMSETSSIGPNSPTIDGSFPDEQETASQKLADKAETGSIRSNKSGVRYSDGFGETTRKISITPKWLQDDTSSIRSADTRDSSLDSLEKVSSLTDKTKDEKKKKEKKQGMLSGLFKSKKKDKKAEKSKMKEFVSEGDVERVSIDAARHSTASLPAGDAVAKGKEVQRRASLQKRNKLQKAAPDGSVPPAGPEARETSQFVAELEGSQVAYEVPTGLEHSIAANNVQKQKTKKAKQRLALDDFDATAREQETTEDESREAAAESEDAEPDTPTSFMHGTESVHIPVESDDAEALNGQQDHESEVTDGEAREVTGIPASTNGILQRSDATTVEPAESYRIEDDDATPVPSKPHSPTPASTTTTTAPTTTPSTDAAQSIPVLSRTPPPDTEPSTHEPQRRNSKSSTTSSSRNYLSPSPASTTNTTWSDAGLRAWLEGDNDVRDMLVVIHDKSGVRPAGKDHPLMAGLFAEESRSLENLSGELDGLLGGFLQRRGKAVSVPV